MGARAACGLRRVGAGTARCGLVSLVHVLTSARYAWGAAADSAERKYILYYVLALALWVHRR